nr:MAG TPA: hypothetical protein [Caudoviricetes sp.]
MPLEVENKTAFPVITTERPLKGYQSDAPKIRKRFGTNKQFPRPSLTAYSQASVWGGVMESGFEIPRKGPRTTGEPVRLTYKPGAPSVV